MNHSESGDPLANASREEIMSALFANMVVQQTNLAMMNYPVTQTHLTVLTNRYWQVNLNLPFASSQFFWLQSR